MSTDDKNNSSLGEEILNSNNYDEYLIKNKDKKIDFLDDNMKNMFNEEEENSMNNFFTEEYQISRKYSEISEENIPENKENKEKICENTTMIEEKKFTQNMKKTIFGQK